MDFGFRYDVGFDEGQRRPDAKAAGRMDRRVAAPPRHTHALARLVLHPVLAVLVAAGSFTCPYQTQPFPLDQKQARGQQQAIRAFCGAWCTMPGE